MTDENERVPGGVSTKDDVEPWPRGAGDERKKETYDIRTRSCKIGTRP